VAEQTPLDRFKAVLTGTARAIAREPEVELAFTADAPVQAGRHLKVPMPGRNLPPEQVAEARGFADSFALKLRHHDAALHARAAPGDAVARAAFDAVEQVRIEALGGRNMAGVKANLADAHAMRMRSDPITRARSREEVPLSSAIALLARERLTGEPVPEAAKGGLSLVRDWIEEKAGADLDALGLALDDQAAFQKLATRLLEDLERRQAALSSAGVGSIGEQRAQAAPEHALAYALVVIDGWVQMRESSEPVPIVETPSSSPDSSRSRDSG